jgi:hypothetical protein
MSIPISDKFKPKGIGGFALIDAEDVEYEDGRLPDYMMRCVTQEEYDALKAAGNLNPLTPYLIVSDEE